MNDQGLSSPDIEQLRDHAESTQANVEQFANDHAGIDIENQFWLTNAVVATVDTETITLDQLALIKGVEKIHADFEVEAESASASVSPSLSSDTVSTEEDTTYGLDQINASEAWSQYNTRGEGVKVAVLDTGVDAAHDDIDLYTDDSTDPTYPGGWAEFDSSGDQVAGSEPHDTDTHGTHVSGTVAGGNAAGTYIGVAPETNLMHGLVMPDNGGSFSQIIGGMEWAVENDADVISMSLGADGYYSSFIDPIRTAESQGVVVIASIGNDGEGTSSSPGNEYDSVGVGATNSDGDVSGFSGGELIDTDSAWGSSAPNDWPDQYIVPSISAPGYWIPSAVPGNEYQYKSGTSMAAPHVAGAVALIQSATSEHKSPDEIKQALQETAWKPSDWDESNAAASIDGQDTRYGHGIIDVPAAIEYLKSGSDPAPSFSVVSASLDTSTILEGESVTVSADVENSGDADGTFTAELQEDGTVIATKDVTVAAGTTETVTFTQTYNTAGTYDLAVSGTTAGTLTVEQPASFTITGTSLNSSTITEGESVTVSADVENTGDRDGDFTADLVVDGSAVQTTTVTVAAGTTETVSFTETFDTAGDYAIDVNDAAVGTLTVEAATADFTVSGASLTDTTILEGDTAEATATVENVGSDAGEFTAEFRLTDANGQTTVRDSATVTLAAGESTSVTLADTVSSSGTYDADVSGEPAGTLTVEQPATFGIVSTTLSEQTILEGESVTVSADVENTGDRDGDFTADLVVDGSAVQTTTVTVAAGTTETVSFTETFDTAGDYAIDVNDAAVGTLTVEAATADFTVSGASLTDTTILEGDTAEATATVENVGSDAGEFTAEFRLTDANGQTTVRDSATVTLAAGESTSVTLADTVSSSGTYDADVSGEPAGTLTVEQPARFALSAGSLSDGEIEDGESTTVSATVENLGDREGTFTAELRVDGSTTQTTDVTLAGGTSETVSFSYEPPTTGEYVIDVAGNDNDGGVTTTSAGTLTVLEPASFAVSNPTLSDTEILEGEVVTATATVENTGEAEGTFTATLEVTADGATEVRDSTDVTLAGGQTTEVTLDEGFTQPGEYAVAISGVDAGTLTVQEATAAFETSGVTLSENTILEGESVTVSATVENVGDEAGEHSATVFVDGNATGSTVVSLAAGESTTVTFEETIVDAGTYDVTVDDAPAETLTVDQPATFELNETGLEPTTILEGESIEATATVENVGDETGTFTAELQVGSTVRASQDVTLDPGQTATVGLTTTLDEPGAYDVAISGTGIGTVTVEAATAEFDVTNPTLADDTILAGETASVTATVENVGTEAGEFTAEFRLTDASGETTTRDTATVSLSVGESTEVTLADTVGEPGTYDVDILGNSSRIDSSEVDSEDTTATSVGTLQVDSPARFELTGTSVESSTVLVGESVTMTATVHNDGDRDGETTLQFLNGAEVLDDASVALAGGESTTVSLEWVPEETHVGEHALTVETGDDSDVVSVTVESPSEAAFDVGIRGTNAPVDAGETVAVDVLVENVGDGTDSRTVALSTDGVERDTATVDLAPGARERITLEWTTGTDDNGRYTARVSSADDVDTVGVTVSAGKRGVGSYADEDGVVQTDGMRQAITDWRKGGVDTDLLRAVIDAWRSSDPLA
ncbi:MAG: CARDB domain-containing protein [Halovenus sp.]